MVAVGRLWYGCGEKAQMTAMRRLDEPEIAAILNRVLCAAERPGLLSAYLFGSQREGRAHRESDVDVGILLDRTLYPTRRARFEGRLRLTSWLAAKLQQRAVDVVILNDAPACLARHIVTAGERMFCSNAAADHDFVRDAQLRAADLEPFLRRARRIKLVALAR